ncbi:MAG: DUF4041 domain-containing protein [Methanobrevibacter sp.]|nr:DUF4041 domain-containing protein [Methanobrevibacter sp.]
MNREFIIILVGLLLTITIVGAIVGLPLIAIGAYLLNKKVDNPTDEIQEEINKKEKELNNIDEKLTKMEADKKAELEKLEEEKTIEIENNLKHKQEELDNIDETLDKLERERTELIDIKLKTRKEELDHLDEKYEELTKQKEEKLDKELAFRKEELADTQKELAEIKKELILSKDELNFQEYGLYEPKYNFINSTAYKERLDAVRKQQKQMIKDKTAAIATREWTVDGDKRKGQAMTNANIKQILRSFNNETEVIINKVKHSNLDNSRKRIEKSFTQLNKLYEREHVQLTKGYLNLKLDEMHIAYEYELKKEEEKEELREAREREREEKKLQKELEREKKKFDKENTKITSEIEQVKQELTNAAAEEKAKLEAEIAKLQAALDKNNEEITKIDKYRETPGAGYVYIISNVGSFGEDVFKIGVTRRDNPEDRIRELSSASVPFRFDSHVFIFSDKAYDLESSLHERFDKQRVNKVNRRKEFFRISMDDVKQIVEENKGAVHSFVERPDNEEYFDTLKIEKSMK